MKLIYNETKKRKNKTKLGIRILEPNLKKAG